MGNVPKIILQNPFRILGVYANSSKRDILANKGKATAFLKVNRPVEYPLDLKGILPPVSRTVEQFNEAESHLTIAKEQIRFAQFWFLKMTPLDDIAFNHLFTANIDEAISIWSKKNSLASLQNKMLCYLIKGNLSEALLSAQQLYNTFGDGYIVKIDSSSTLHMSAIELRNLFIDSLGEDVGTMNLLKVATDADWKTYISSQTIGPLISKISSEVDKAKRVDHKNPKARFDAARKLASATKEAFTQLKSLLPSSDPQYQMIADKLGLEILQCGIDYYNNSDDDDAPYNAMKVQKQAQSIVVGTLAKQRCDENVKILQKIINDLPPQEVKSEYKAIKAELSKFAKLPDKISYSVSLLNNTKPHLQSMKYKLGVSSSYYLKLSTQVVGNALHNVIEEVNEAQEPLAKLGELLKGMNPYLRSSLLSGGSLDIDEIRNKVKSTLREAWKATILMDEFDLESDFKERYNHNRTTLKSLCSQMGVFDSESGTTYGNNRRTTSESGCMVTLLALMGMVAMSIYCIVSIL